MSRLAKLADYGQSFWLDDLSRVLVREGELARRVREEGLRGITSNPAIFAKAIAGSDAYEEQVGEAARAGRSTAEVYELLTTTDVREACDVLMPVYEESGGADGFVSLEVSPHLAHDTEGSIAEGHRLARTVGRPNLMIKIPATGEGLGAIEQLLADGINVNITLLFSVERYRAVTEAWMRGLERRRQAGQPLDHVASVASFFISRIDTLVDRLLSHRIRPDGSSPFRPHPGELRGRIAIASAKVAYASWRRLRTGERFRALEAAGASPQRLLWASTSTKNPAYEETVYVDSLIGPGTVNTMPLDTAAAFATGGRLTKSLVRAVPEARRQLKELRDLGIDLRRVAWQLEHEGVQKFIEPYDELMSVIDEARSRHTGAPPPAA